MLHSPSPSDTTAEPTTVVTVAKKRRWRWTWWKLDLPLLAAGAISFALYALNPLDLGPLGTISLDPKVEDILGSLAIDLPLLWLTVRIIDRLVELRGRSNEIRLYTLRNLDHWHGFVDRIDRSCEPRELQRLEFELYAFDRRWSQQQAVLDVQERELRMEARRLMGELLKQARNYRQAVDQCATLRQQIRVDPSRPFADWFSQIESLHHELDMGRPPNPTVVDTMTRNVESGLKADHLPSHLAKSIDDYAKSFHAATVARSEMNRLVVRLDTAIEQAIKDIFEETEYE
jgi:hypothetical protein